MPRALSLGLLITLEPLALFPYLWRQVESKVAYRQREPGIKQWCCGWWLPANNTLCIFVVDLKTPLLAGSDKSYGISLDFWCGYCSILGWEICYSSLQT